MLRALLSSGKQLAVAGVAVLVLVGAASAYTVVLKGGKRLQIPDRFIVTPAVLSYEVAPGMNVTLQLAAVDIAETERANNELAGSFVRRLEKSKPTPGESQSMRSVRTITNRDLASYQVARIEHEKAYEASSKENGLPSLTELRSRAERESAAAQEFVTRRYQELQAEDAARRSADQERRVEELSRQIQQDNDQTPLWDSYWPAGVLFGDNSFSRNRHSRFGFNFDFNHRFFPRRPRIFVAPVTRPFGPGRVGGSHPGRR
jgi:hypothetical protein